MICATAVVMKFKDVEYVIIRQLAKYAAKVIGKILLMGIYVNYVQLVYKDVSIVLMKMFALAVMEDTIWQL